MKYTILGRTGLKVSVAGLGSGGHSRLGRATGRSEKESIALVRQALDLGINLIDTSEAYGTESIVGKALVGFPRDRVIISTKKLLPTPEHPNPLAEVRKSLEQSLQKLRTDYIDIYHAHGVKPHEYRYTRDVLAPIFWKMREEGKIRFIGVTEYFGPDPGHRMLQEALEEDCWDVVMPGFNILNPSARERVFNKTTEKNIGVLVMYAVRSALSQPDRFRKVVSELKQKGAIPSGSGGSQNPLSFLIGKDKTASLPEAAYRFCRHEPGVHVVLTGTGNPEHLKANVEALSMPPLPERDLQRLKVIFGKVDSVTGG